MENSREPCSGSKGAEASGRYGYLPKSTSMERSVNSHGARQERQKGRFNLISFAFRWEKKALLVFRVRGCAFPPVELFRRVSAINHVKWNFVIKNTVFEGKIKRKEMKKKRIKNHGRKSDRENYSGVTNGKERY